AHQPLAPRFDLGDLVGELLYLRIAASRLCRLLLTGEAGKARVQEGQFGPVETVHRENLPSQRLCRSADLIGKRLKNRYNAADFFSFLDLFSSFRAHCSTSPYIAGPMAASWRAIAAAVDPAPTAPMRGTVASCFGTLAAPAAGGPGRDGRCNFAPHGAHHRR